MPKRKRGPKPAPATVEERRARQEKVVHREEMNATLGEVLEAEHIDEAIGLLYKQDELSGKAQEPPPPPREVQAPRNNNNDNDSMQQEQPMGDPDATEPRQGVRRFLSPTFMIDATVSATSALISGVRRAVADLREAADRARHAFDATTKRPRQT